MTAHLHFKNTLIYLFISFVCLVRPLSSDKANRLFVPVSIGAGKEAEKRGEKGKQKKG